MSKIIKNPEQFAPVPKPDAEIFLYGKGEVDFAWNFTRKDPFWFLYCNSGPGAYLKFEECEIRPGKKEIILIPPGTPFQSCCESPFEHLYIHFQIGRPYSRVKPGVLIFPSSICGTLEQLFREEQSSPAAVYALLYSALAAIPEERFAPEENGVDDRLQMALIMLNKNASNDEICRSIGMSGSNFQKFFKQKTGISPQQYSMKMRLEKACFLLSSGVNEISSIARECGFSDRYAFSKAFSKYIGIPPARYRQSTFRTGK
ncbi:MAG: helix-turn-helix transcriptional regulator [Lentisphaeria bacterium]|nr:helix-turn-helix transcriptional regulator [Lentisphaeria bacterium]